MPTMSIDRAARTKKKIAEYMPNLTISDMSWIGVAGKTLEFSGKIIQSASFEEWARTKGKDIVEKIATERTIALFGKKRAARNDLWKNLKSIIQQPALQTALSRLASTYPTTIASVASVFENNEYIADGQLGPLSVPGS
jgi:hypothetical protein